MEDTAQEVLDELPDGVDIDKEELVERLEGLTEYLPQETARGELIRKLQKEAQSDSDGGNSSPGVGEIDETGEWIDLNGVKVTMLWDSDSDAVAQVGLLGDETGEISFVSWAKSDLPHVEEGETYNLENVVTDKYDGDYQVKLNSSTEIEAVDTDVTVDTTEVFEGVIVDLKGGSGLIKRCPVEECSQTLDGGRCNDHGNVEGSGEDDLRVKAVFDNGATTQTVIFNAEMTEDVTGVSLEDAKELFTTTMDKEVITNRLKQKLIGQYYQVEGEVLGRYLLAADVERVAGKGDIDELLIKARSI
jgi:replication factor A1